MFALIQKRRSPAGVGKTAGRPPVSFHGRRAAGPVQDRAGLPRGLQASLEKLSGLPMDDVRVHRGSPRPASVGASAYAQGSEIHLGPGGEHHLPHEAWHVVQQKQRRVRPTLREAGLELNDDDRLEREADVMGARAVAATGPNPSPVLHRGEVPGVEAGLWSGWGPGPARPALRPPAPAGPIQRRVDSFEVDSSKVVPPATDLLKDVEADNFEEEEDEVKDAIRDSLLNPKQKAIQMPDKVNATVSNRRKGDTAPERQRHKSSVVGKIGIDEFLIRTGGTFEVFEGGHLIPHSVWDEDDPQVKSADDYVNLVPMSRTVNVGVRQSWKKNEDKIIEAAEKGPIEVEIEIERSDYDVTYGALASTFGLTAESDQEDEKLELYEWIPKKLSGNITKKEKKKGKKKGTKTVTEPLTDVTENVLRTFTGEINDAEKLVETLQATPIWSRMTEDLQGKVENIK